MIVAAKFVADAGRPKHTPIERVIESGESAMFKSFFFQFDPVLTPAMMRAPKVKQAEYQKNILKR